MVPRRKWWTNFTICNCRLKGGVFDGLHQTRYCGELVGRLDDIHHQWTRYYCPVLEKIDVINERRQLPDLFLTLKQWCDSNQIPDELEYLIGEYAMLTYDFLVVNYKNGSLRRLSYRHPYQNYYNLRSEVGLEF